MARVVSWHPAAHRELFAIHPRIARRVAAEVARRLGSADIAAGEHEFLIGRWIFFCRAGTEAAGVYRIQEIET